MGKKRKTKHQLEAKLKALQMLHAQKSQKMTRLYQEHDECHREIERLNGILENMLPTGTVGGRINALETTNEFLEGKTKYQAELIKSQGEKIDLLYREIGEMGATIASQTDALLMLKTESRDERR